MASWSVGCWAAQDPPTSRPERVAGQASHAFQLVQVGRSEPVQNLAEGVAWLPPDLSCLGVVVAHRASSVGQRVFPDTNVSVTNGEDAVPL